jgi:hypothetical protein
MSDYFSPPATMKLEAKERPGSPSREDAGRTERYSSELVVKRDWRLRGTAENTYLSKLVVGAPAFMRGSSALKPSGSRRTILLRL